MQQLFLTSSVHAVAHDIAKKVDLAQGNRLVFIDTAAEPIQDEKEWLRNDRQALVDAGFDVTDYTITGKAREQLEKDLEGYEYIYLSGGVPSHLLGESRKSGFFELIQELIRERGKTYIGTSAGSIAAGPKLQEYYLEDEDVTSSVSGYGFVNFGIMPHWGSKSFREKYFDEKRLEIAYKRDQIPLVFLTDNQYVHVQGEKMEIVDTLKVQ